MKVVSIRVLISDPHASDEELILMAENHLITGDFYDRCTRLSSKIRPFFSGYGDDTPEPRQHEKTQTQALDKSIQGV